MPRKTDKRIRLIEAAKYLMHQQGFNLTTLADIAQEADVPLGNVYYYFKTKEAIGEAVIESRVKELHERLQAWDSNPNVRERVNLFLQYEVEQAELTAKCGCPIGGLCQELAKQGGLLADAAAKLLNDVIEWAEKQFRLLGISETSIKDQALQFVSTVQGMSLLTNTFKDPNMANTMKEMISKRLNSILGSVQDATTMISGETAIA